MNERSEKLFIRSTTVIIYILMIVVNALANFTKFNGVSTSEITAKFDTLLTPLGLTFLVWIIIYVLMGIYTIYQWQIIKVKRHERSDLLTNINIYFNISSASNTIWIISWHQEMIWLSLINMIVLFVSLMRIMKLIKWEDALKPFTKEENIKIKYPFSIYFGWITMALLINIFVFLRSISWVGFGISSEIGSILFLLTGLYFSVINIFRYESLTYGITILWALIGIFTRHININGYHLMYPGIIMVIFVSIIVLIAAMVKMKMDVKNENKKLIEEDYELEMDLEISKQVNQKK